MAKIKVKYNKKQGEIFIVTCMLLPLKVLTKKALYK